MAAQMCNLPQFSLSSHVGQRKAMPSESLGRIKVATESGCRSTSILAELTAGDKRWQKRRVKTEASSSSAPRPSQLPQLIKENSEPDWNGPDILNESVSNLSGSVSGSHDLARMRKCIDEIRLMFKTLRDGEISMSPYDTAWVAMVPALDGSKGPQFPDCLTWIASNQLRDGSWGETDLFVTYDRVINTLACVVALQTWQIDGSSVKRGCDFLRDNVDRIAEESENHMPIGFEIVFPKLMEMGRELGLQLPYDSDICKRILVERERKLRKIPMDFLHSYPSTLLHSLEGLHDLLDWERLLKLQAKGGSFLFSPASTACALMHTGDAKCLQYLNSTLQKFDNAVPNVYPVDLFERMWMVDRLERLGIARFFQEEITACLDYVYQYWGSSGVAWARESAVTDVDDTAMGFRLLRLHGYDVSPDVFLPFQSGDEFFCFGGQMGQAVTGMFNFYRASQTLFPGEALLEKAKSFCGNFLKEKLHNNDVSDKWIIAKDLPGEVAYALEFPWYASLPGIEIRAYLDHYGPNDIWIGKCLYKMPNVNNTTFLDLAKIDFSMRQKLYQSELQQHLKWDAEQQFCRLEFARQKATEGFFSAAATMYEPELTLARKIWAKNCVLTTIVDDYLDVAATIDQARQFKAAVDSWDPRLIDADNQEQQIVFMGMYNSINSMAAEASVAQGRDVSKHLIGYYKRWVESCLLEGEWASKLVIPKWDEYIRNAEPSIALECIMLSSMFFLGEELSDALCEGEEWTRLTQRVSLVGRLLNDIQSYQREATEGKAGSVVIYMRDHPEKTEEQVFEDLRNIVDATMRQLTSEVLQQSQLPHPVKKVFFHMARIMQLFYKDEDGFSSLTAMKEHVNRLLFQPLASPPLPNH